MPANDGETRAQGSGHRWGASRRATRGGPCGFSLRKEKAGKPVAAGILPAVEPGVPPGGWLFVAKKPAITSGCAQRTGAAFERLDRRSLR